MLKVELFLFIIILSCFYSCKSDQPEKVIKAAVKQKSEEAILSDIYQHYSSDPVTQHQKDENAIIEYIAEHGLSAKRSSSGLYYAIDTLGQGPLIRRGDQVRAHYKGYFLNGKEFDSSYSRNKPLWFTVGQMAAGWDEGMTYLNAGSRATLLLPSYLGYGEQGFPGYVEPNTVILFDIAVLE